MFPEFLQDLGSRFYHSRHKYPPKIEEISFKPASLLKKIEEESLSRPDLAMEAEFLFLSDANLKELKRKTKMTIRSFKARGQIWRT